MNYVDLDAHLDVMVQTVSSGKQGTAVVHATVTDSRPFVPVKKVGLSVNWGDGSPVQSVELQVSPYTTALSHTYKPGSYIIRVNAKNYQIPVPDTDSCTFDVVVSTQSSLVKATEDGLQPIIYGPIMPRESYPNADDWRWHMSQDSILLESSAKLLLMTQAGDMLMNPGYGTNIRSLVFNPSDSSLKDALLQELRRSFALFEPRASIVSADVQGVGSKEITVRVQLVSNLDQRPFQIATTVIKT